MTELGITREEQSLLVTYFFGLKNKYHIGRVYEGAGSPILPEIDRFEKQSEMFLKSLENSQPELKQLKEKAALAHKKYNEEVAKLSADMQEGASIFVSSMNDFYSVVNKLLSNPNNILKILQREEEEKKLKKVMQNLNDFYGFKSSTLSKWFDQKKKEFKVLSFDKFCVHVIEDFVSPEQWDKLAHEKITMLQQKYGFNKIAIEGEPNKRELFKWAQQLDQVIDSVMQDLNLPLRTASLHGYLNLCYKPSYLEIRQSGGMIVGGTKPSMLVRMNHRNGMRKTFIHEFSHALDKLAGLRYYHEKNPTQSWESINRSYYREKSVFLSQQILEEITLGANTAPKTADLSRITSFIHTMITGRDKGLNEMPEKIHKIESHMAKLFMITVLNGTGIDWSLLPETTQKNVINHASQQVKNMIELVSDMKAKTINQNFFNGQAYEENSAWHNTMRAIQKELGLPDMWLDKAWKDMPAITISFETIMDNYAMTMVKGLNEKFPMLAQEKVAHASLQEDNKESNKRRYFASPLELFARHMESIYPGIKEDFIHLYPESSTEQAQQYKKILRSLVRVAGLSLVQSPKKDIMDNINCLRTGYKPKGYQTT